MQILAHEIFKVKNDMAPEIVIEVLLIIKAISCVAQKLCQGRNPGENFFNIFLNAMLWFVEKSGICNFADDSTIYSCVKSIIDG